MRGQESQHEALKTEDSTNVNAQLTSLGLRVDDTTHDTIFSKVKPLTLT